METYLPIIKNTFDQLYQMTLDNYIYAGTIAILAWFITAFFYSIRIAFLNRRHRKTDQARIEAQSGLEATQLKLTQHQEELGTTSAELEQSKLAAEQLQQRLSSVESIAGQHNKKIGDLIQFLATQLDLGERPLPVPEDFKADDLWSQHDRVVKQTLDRLKNEQLKKTELQQAYQTETAKLAEKDIMLNTLKTTLDLQTGQLSSLESALAEQKNLVQHYQVQAQQKATNIVESQPSSLAANVESFTQTATAAPVFTAPQPTIAAETPKAPDFSFSPEHSKPAELINEAIHSAATSFEEYVAKPAAHFTENLHLPTKEEIMQPIHHAAEVIEEFVEPVTSQVSSFLSEQEELGLIIPKAVDEIKAKVSSNDKTGVAGKLKGLFGKKEAAKTPEKPAADPSKSVEKAKGWLGKLTSKK